MVLLLSKLDVVKDPGNLINTLENIINHREQLQTLLLKKERIHLTIDKLVQVLTHIQDLSEGTIKACFELEPQKWEAYAVQLSNKEEKIEDSLALEVVQDIYTKHTTKLKEAFPLEEMFEISKAVSEEVEIYRHCNYQSCLAAIIVS
jgi:hypothetical protein